MVIISIWGKVSSVETQYTQYTVLCKKIHGGTAVLANWRHSNK